MQIASKSHDLVPKASKSCLCLRGFAQFFFTSRELRRRRTKDEKNFCDRYFYSTCTKALLLDGFNSALLACLQPYYFFLPKKNLNFTYHHHQSLHTFSEGLTTHIVKGQRATTSPRPHTGPWSLSLASKTCQKNDFPTSHMCCFAAVLPNWNYNINNSYWFL